MYYYTDSDATENSTCSRKVDGSQCYVCRRTVLYTTRMLNCLFHNILSTLFVTQAPWSHYYLSRVLGLRFAGSLISRIVWIHTNQHRRSNLYLTCMYIHFRMVIIRTCITYGSVICFRKRMINDIRDQPLRAIGLQQVGYMFDQLPYFEQYRNMLCGVYA